MLALLRRVLLTLVGAQLATAVGSPWSTPTAGAQPGPFPTGKPTTSRSATARVTTYTFGQDLYDDMLAAIESAQRQILFETYIWKADPVGERFKAALVAAADRGVDVYLIYDSWANLVVAPQFKHFPPGLHVLRYPAYAAGLRFWDLRRYGRDHRKILVVDEQVAFVGGYNIGSAYATEWRDTHVRITGPAVWDLQRGFADFWNLHRRRRPGPSERPLLLETASEWEPRIRVHRNVPRLWMFPIRAMYLEAINRATRNVWLTHAYFIPDQDFVDALVAAARRRRAAVVPLKSNHIVTDWISRGYYSQLLEAGVRILRFRDAMVHAKTATIDGEWSTVAPRTSTAPRSRATTRSTSRSSTPAWPR
ncbi:MAG: phospholipase D-like domain-containing protein [Nocardioides sp.]